MLMHILFLLASWLLEILFSFYSNYFFFQLQKISAHRDVVFGWKGCQTLGSSEQQLLYFIFGYLHQIFSLYAV